MAAGHRKQQVNQDPLCHPVQGVSCTRGEKTTMICRTCATRKLGEDLCELHPEASAFHDRNLSRLAQQRKRETQINQLDDTCDWVATHGYGAPQDTTHILACVCDKCGKLTTLNLCAACHNIWVRAASSAGCGNCNGTLSWQTRDLATGDKVTQINPGSL